MRIITLLAVIALPATAAAEPLFNPRDFVEYWAAARVHLNGGNPYDGATVLPFQQEASGDPEKHEAVSLWTPPWTLPLYWPFGALDPRTGHLVWIAAQLTMIVASGFLLWSASDGPANWRVLGLAAVVLFSPTFWTVVFAQNTGFLILGLAGFLALWRKGWFVAAGMVAALTAIKPHLLGPFAVALALGVFDNRGRRVLLGGVIVLIVGSILALIPNPYVFGQLVEAFSKPRTAEQIPVSDWMVPTLSYLLRAEVAPETFAVQFIPCLIGCIATIPYYIVRRTNWDWIVEAPRLVLASILLAPYGAWIFDLTVLLVPIGYGLALATRTGRTFPIVVAAAGHLIISLFAMNIGPLHSTVWFAPAVLGWFVVVLFLSRRPT